MKLKWIKPIYSKIGKNLAENLDQGQNKTEIKKRNSFESVNNLCQGWELIVNAFRSGIFPMKEKQGKGWKILTPKQMLHRLTIVLAQVKACNTSANLLNGIRQIIYSL